MKKRIISFFLSIMLVLSTVEINSIHVFAFFNNIHYVIDKDGYFAGTNNQSGAINDYWFNASLLTDDTVIYVEHSDGSGDITSSYYWAASQTCVDDSMEHYVVEKKRLFTLRAGGNTVTYKVIEGKLSISWPTYNGMICRYDLGNEAAQERPNEENPNEENPNKENPNKENPEVDSNTIDLLKKLKMDELFKDGKFVLFASKEVKQLFGEDSDVISFLGSFFENGFMVEDEGIPIAINYTQQENGSLLWKIIFPKDSSDEESVFEWYESLYTDEPAWDEYKNFTELAKDNISKVMELSQKVNDRDFPVDVSLMCGGVKLIDGASILSDFFEPDLSVCGYLEFMTDKDFNLISGNGQVAGTIEADSKKYIRQYFSNVGLIGLPWYWEVDYNYKGGISLDVVLKRDRLNRVQMQRGGKVDCVGNINAAAGVGVYGIVNAQGNLSMNVQAELFPNRILTINGTVDASIRFLKYYKSNVIGPYTFKKTLWNEKLADEVIQVSESPQEYVMSQSIVETMDLWSESNTKNKEMGISLMSVVEPLSENEWLGADGANYSIHGLGTDGHILLSNSIQGCDPRIIRLGDKSILLFTVMTSEDTENAGRLMYSVKANNVWSEPKLLWDNGCPDYFADMQVIGENAYVVWQKSSDVVDGVDAQSMFDSAITKSEICMAEFDSKSDTFINQKYITSNNYLDMMPKFVKNTNKVAISFISNIDNDFIGKSDSTISLVTYENGIWSEISEIAKVSGYIGEYETYMSNNNCKVLYSSMDVSVISENEKILSNLFITDGKLTDIINKDANSILGLQYYDGRMFWLCDGSLYNMDCSSGTVRDMRASEENMNGKSIGADFRVFGNGNKTSIVWGASSETGYSIYSALINANRISKPLEVFQHEGGIVESYDVSMNADGNYCYVINDMDNSDSKYTMSEVVKEVQDNIELTNVYMPDYDREDDKQPVSLTIMNQGESIIKNLCMKIVSNNTEYVKQEFTTSINPGESACITGSFILPRISNPKEFTVMIYPSLQGEEFASKYVTTLGNTDVAVEVTKEIDKEKGTGIVLCKVTNHSNTETDCTLNIYLGNGQNELVKKYDILELGAGQSEYIKYDINSKDLDFMSDIAALCAVVQSKVDDYCISNNSAILTFSKEEFSTEISTPEEPATDESTTKEPSIEKPTPEEPTTEESTTKEPSIEYPTIEEQPATEESTTKEPSIEYPTIEEPTTEKSTIKEPSIEEPTTEEATTEEHNVEKPVLVNRLAVIKTYQLNKKAYALQVEAKTTDGGNLRYQWYKNTRRSSHGAEKISGATRRTYRPTTNETGTRYYFCYITNEKGDKMSEAINSGYAKITVKKLPNRITVAETKIIKEYASPSFTIVAKGHGDITYTSTNKSIVAVNSRTGKVTLKGIGSAYILIKAGDSKYETVSKKIKITVVLKRCEIKSIRSDKKGKVSLIWKKCLGIDGYYMEYGMDAGFKNKTTLKLGRSTVQKTIKNFRSGKRYYVRMRSYKKINNTVHYGDWSRAVRVRVK